jgi:hypothetical protein
MADWIYKEGNWKIKDYGQFEYTDLGGETLTLGKYDRGIRKFTEWLNWHCEGGWEVFKISRDFNGDSGTWCIFRKKE